MKIIVFLSLFLSLVSSFAQNKDNTQSIMRDFSEFLPKAVSQASHAVASLYLYSDDQIVSFCNAFLISSDLVMTNNHCLPEGDLKKYRVMIEFKIPKDPKFRSERYMVVGIVSLNKHDDILILKLEEPVQITNVIPLIINLNHEIPKHPWRVSYYFNQQYVVSERPGYSATMAIEPCSKHLIEGNSIVMSFCTLRPGNSGSPLLNDHGEVIGINKAIMTDLPDTVVKGTEYIVGRIGPIFATPMYEFKKDFESNNDKLNNYLSMKGLYDWDRLRIIPLNYQRPPGESLWD